jgi:hypothetical protein
MPTTVALIEDGHIIHYVFADPWTLDDMVLITREGKHFYDRSDHKIHVLLDVSRTRKVPPGILTARNNPDMTHPNSGHIAIVGAAGIIKAIGELIVKTTNMSKIGFYTSEQEAWVYLRQLIAKETEA